MVKIMNIKYRLFNYLRKIKFTNILSDKTFLKISYFVKMEKKLDLENPQTYSEKLQWLKLHDRNPEYTKMVDKYEVKEYVRKIIGDQYIIPTIGIYNSFDEINFDELPNQFVIKCTHDSGGLIIVKDKTKFDVKNAKKVINKCLKNNFFYAQREWPSKNVKPRIIIEEYMEDAKTSELRDYKFFCFDGVVKALFIASDRNSKSETKFDFFDEKFNHLNFTNGHPNALTQSEKPIQFELMIKLAEKLSHDIPHVRVDFYEVNGNVYFGEMTFYHWSGMTKFDPEEWDYKFGSWINLDIVGEK